MMLARLGLLTLAISGVLSHSWISCPQSFNTMPTRGGFFNGPCENKLRAGDTAVGAGDRLKIGWTSNNHAGGFVRLALVPESQHKNNKNFEQNVIKVACYGKDQRPGGTRYGDCVHPCNTRPGCEYQSDPLDVERYDTTITIPTNLKDGKYILQYAALVGNAVKPYFSCATLTVTGGNPNLKCKSNKPPTIYKCHRSGGPPMSKIATGMKRGEFCYHADKIGEVDDRIREVPINVDCDPRITCANSISNKKCMAAENMSKIKNAWNPKQPNCGNVKPPPPPTCDDKRQNQGETDVDCGGPCKACPTVPPNTGLYHSKIEHKMKHWGAGEITVHIIKDVPRNWILTVQYDKPIKIGATWGGGAKFWTNSGGNIIKFKRVSWSKLPKKGGVVSVKFNSNGNSEIIPLTMVFELEDKKTLMKRDAPDCKTIRCKKGHDCVTEWDFPCYKAPCISWSYCKKTIIT